MSRRPARAVLVTTLVVATAALLWLADPPGKAPPEPDAEIPSGGRWIGPETGASPEEARPGVPFHFAAPPALSPRELDRRILSLGARLARSTTDADARSDLAAALLARSELADRPVDLLEALVQVQYALEESPRLPEALYNRALVLTRLGLRGPARGAWESYLQDDSRSAWAEAARLRLAALQEPTLRERWEGEGRDALMRAARSGRGEESIELVATYPTFARLWIEEELLRVWAEEAAAGTPRETAVRLETLHLLGQTLADAIGDHTVADTLRRVEEAPVEERGPLVEGLRLYGQAMASYRAFGSEREKHERLERAERVLEGAGVPLWRWARFYRAVGWHRTRPELARRELAALAKATSSERQPALLARIEWLLGTNEVTRNRYERSLEHYRRARDLLAMSEGPQAAAFIDVLLGETLSKLGDLEAGWAARLAAVRDLAPLGDPQRLHAALYSAVEQLFLEGREAAAEPYVEELVENASQWGAAPGVAEAALQEGRFRASRGAMAEARESFRRAWTAAAEIGDDSLRSRTEATIALYEAESLVDAPPGRSERVLEQARADMVALGYRYQLPRIDAARAALHLAQGDREAALVALHSSVAEYESIRRNVSDISMRASAFEGAQRAFDLLVELELGSPDGDGRAFLWAERSRARVVLDLLADDPEEIAGWEGPVTLEDLSRELPADTDLLELAVLPDRLVGWWVRREGSIRFDTAIEARVLERLVGRFRQAVQYGDDEAIVQEAGRELWRLLLGPVSDDLENGRRLVIVPDRFLGRVPFPALFDPGRGSYLIEERSLVIAPSATAYLAARAARSALGAGPATSVLAVGANHPEQVRLPGVSSEAQAVGDLYPRADVLTGEAATRARFLEALETAQVVHFAGHGEDDAASFTRSRLFFRPGTADDAGVLFSHEIAARRLRETRVAVLAACRSVTPDLRGRENVSGLAAAFLAAGVPTVIASLWEVEDATTGAVMTDFHRYLRRGIPPDEALQRAQTELARSTSIHRAPRYWAGFVAVGAD